MELKGEICWKYLASTSNNIQKAHSRSCEEWYLWSSSCKPCLSKRLQYFACPRLVPCGRIISVRQRCDPPPLHYTTFSLRREGYLQIDRHAVSDLSHQR